MPLIVEVVTDPGCESSVALGLTPLFELCGINHSTVNGVRRTADEELTETVTLCTHGISCHLYFDVFGTVDSDLM